MEGTSIEGSEVATPAEEGAHQLVTLALPGEETGKKRRRIRNS